MQTNTKTPQPYPAGIHRAIISYATRYPHLAKVAIRAILGYPKDIVAIAQQIDRLSMPDDVTLQQLQALRDLARTINPNCL